MMLHRRTGVPDLLTTCDRLGRDETKAVALGEQPRVVGARSRVEEIGPRDHPDRRRVLAVVVRAARRRVIVAGVERAGQDEGTHAVEEVERVA